MIALAGAAGFAVVSGSALPLLLGAGLELIYLSTVPQNSRFRRLVRSWKFAEEKRLRDIRLSTMFHELPPEMRTRYANLEAVSRKIRENYGRLSATSQIFVAQMEDRLQGLLQGYLRLLGAANQHRDYLRSTDVATIKRESSELQRSLETDSPKVQDINRKRIEILSKRLQKYEKIRENCQVVDAQCAAIEDVLELIRDQSVTLRNPQEVSDQLESLVHETEHTEETVREVESIFDQPDLMAAILPEEAAGSASDPARKRVRN